MPIDFMLIRINVHINWIILIIFLVNEFRTGITQYAQVISLILLLSIFFYVDKSAINQELHSP